MGRYSQSNSLEKYLIASIVSFSTPEPPRGFLKCNGAELDRVLYSKLFAVIGETFGAGDGLTTFNLPDLRGEFLRGFDDGKGIDVGRVFGTKQVATSVGSRIFQQAIVQIKDSDGIASSNSLDSTGLKRGSSTNHYHMVRPRNISILYCIKY
jgi:microcystin-dependent protein